MKLSYIIGIIIIAVSIAVIASTTANTSTYVSFKEADEMIRNNNDNEVHVVGKLKKDGAGKIVGMEYQPQIDPNEFAFILVDKNNQEKRVLYNEPKPQDFEHSEQIVIIGKMQGDHFKASKILMKCPSKYQETTPKVTENR